MHLNNDCRDVPTRLLYSYSTLFRMASKKPALGIGSLFDYARLSSDVDSVYFHVKFYGRRHRVAEWKTEGVGLSNQSEGPLHRAKALSKMHLPLFGTTAPINAIITYINFRSVEAHYCCQ